VLMCCTGTALNCRVVEVAFFQICDFLRDHDAPYHEMYQGTAAVRIFLRKQDTGRKGHLPRLGRASNIEWDLVLRLRRYGVQGRVQQGRGQGADIVRHSSSLSFQGSAAGLRSVSQSHGRWCQPQ
jgi:hypothetical protein